MNEYRQTAEAIIAAVGGKENIAAATHCATRLRMVLKDEGKIDKVAINAIPLAKGNFLTAGQFQIILGTGTVNKVTAELLDITGVANTLFTKTYEPFQPFLIAAGIYLAITLCIVSSFRLIEKRLSASS